MARKGPKTRAGIETVKRNLPPPDRSGPITERGKRIASLNSTKHGLRTGGFLPCKKDRCYFRQLCELLQVEGAQSVLESIDYGDPCPIEVEQYVWFRERLDKELTALGVQDKGLCHVYAMTEILIERCHRLLAIEPDLVRRVPVKSSCYTRPAQAVAFRYMQELWAKKHRLLDQIIAYTTGLQSPDLAQHLGSPPMSATLGHEHGPEGPGTIGI